LTRHVLRPHVPAPTHLYPLSLHDALPISRYQPPPSPSGPAQRGRKTLNDPRSPADNEGMRTTRHPALRWTALTLAGLAAFRLLRSEEHTSELQSRENLVCRLLLEKKKTPQ